MAKIIDELKKGNITLTNKVIELQQHVKYLEKINIELRKENNELSDMLWKIDRENKQKEQKEQSIINKFGNIYSIVTQHIDLGNAE